MNAWHAVVTEIGADGRRHFWNATVQARDAADAAEQAVVGYDPERVVAVEVERVGSR